MSDNTVTTNRTPDGVDCAHVEMPGIAFIQKLRTYAQEEQLQAHKMTQDKYSGSRVFYTGRLDAFNDVLTMIDEWLEEHQ